MAAVTGRLVPTNTDCDGGPELLVILPVLVVVVGVVVGGGVVVVKAGVDEVDGVPPAATPVVTGGALLLGTAGTNDVGASVVATVGTVVGAALPVAGPQEMSARTAPIKATPATAIRLTIRQLPSSSLGTDDSFALVWPEDEPRRARRPNVGG